MARDPLGSFHPAIREWFGETFPRPTAAQERAWPEIAAGRSTLLLAPTGSGKTLAAFLTALERLLFAPLPGGASRCRVLYISPLRALAVDVEKNLRAPLAGIAERAERRGDRIHMPAVALRTGDTQKRDRARMSRTPPDLLITTPESLYLILSSAARAMLHSVEVVIVDEIHVLVGTKRGAHLALSLERVEELAGRPLQRIGLSATQRPLQEVARFLGGGQAGTSWQPRPVSIVDAGARKAFDLRVEVPADPLASAPTLSGAGGRGRSVWPSIHPRLLELVRSHRTTILFVNSRRLAERLAAALNELAGEPVARAHHGSIAREQRLAIEDALKAGHLPAIVATSSLELGIDMGTVDLVVQIEAPPSVASGMQRIGRASHQAEAVSRGVLFPKHRADLLATAAVARAIDQGAIEETVVPANPLDVLAQHLVSMAAVVERRVDDLFALVRRAAPFATLTRSLFDGVLDMLSGRYPSPEFSELKPRLTWDRRRGVVRGREGALRLVVSNAGTIPDRGLYGAFLTEAPGRAGRRVGELDEEMVFESREGEVFVLGASSWRILEINRDRVLVEPAPGQPGKMPFWRADRPGRPVALGQLIGRLTRELLAASPQAALRKLADEHALDDTAAQNLLAYLDEQRAATGAVPDDRTLVLERTRDEMGDFRLCVLSSRGARLHTPWALAIEARLRERGFPGVETVASDDGIVIRLPDCERPPEASDLVPEAEEVEALVSRELAGSSLFAASFREAAGRALLLPRRRPGLRSPLWMQRKRAADLLAIAARYPSFPLLLEAYRECLKDVFDLPALLDFCRQVERRQIRLVTVDTPVTSPFSASLLFGYVANYLYEGDLPLAERKAHALVVDPRQLRELLGEAELGDLLDLGALQEIEARLQATDPDRRGNSPDRLHDLLLRLGDLSLPEIAARSESAAPDLLARLLAEGRAVPLNLGGEERFAASEDAARFRDALGVRLPPGLPEAFLEPVPRPLRDLVTRYARNRGPFLEADLVERYPLAGVPFSMALRELGEEGRLIEGAFRPGRPELHEWCDAEVLSAWRRASLARARREVEPAPAAALARLAVAWQGIVISGGGDTRSGPDALLDVVEQLQGAVFPASVLEADLLPARLPGYRPSDLDTLCAAGEMVWAGHGPLGERDGFLALYLTDDMPRLFSPPGNAPGDDIHQRLRDFLSAHGASFFGDLHRALGGLERGLLDALWDLIWAGEVVNDSVVALRAFLAGGDRRRRAGRPPLSSFRSRRQAPPSALGRFSLLDLAHRSTASSTERAAALAEQLLTRHGVLTRDAILAEAAPGGFSALYPVLRAMEETGRIRRGYFVSGQGGSQFALPGALDLLREQREARPDPKAMVLASTDPANAFGTTLPWPTAGERRLARSAGTHVVLADGELIGYLSRGESEMLTFLPKEEPDRSRRARALAQGLALWARRTGRLAIGWGSLDGGPAAQSAITPFLLAAGFVRSGPGLRLAAGPVGATDSAEV